MASPSDTPEAAAGTAPEGTPDPAVQDGTQGAEAASAPPAAPVTPGETEAPAQETDWEARYASRQGEFDRRTQERNAAQEGEAAAVQRAAAYEQRYGPLDEGGEPAPAAAPEAPAARPAQPLPPGYPQPRAETYEEVNERIATLMVTDPIRGYQELQALMPGAQPELRVPQNSLTVDDARRAAREEFTAIQKAQADIARNFDAGVQILRQDLGNDFVDANEEMLYRFATEHDVRDPGLAMHLCLEKEYRERIAEMARDEYAAEQQRLADGQQILATGGRAPAPAQAPNAAMTQSLESQGFPTRPAGQRGSD